MWDPLRPELQQLRIARQGGSFLQLFFFSYFETGFVSVALAVQDSLCRIGWPRTHVNPPASASASPRAGIEGVHARLP